MSTINQILEHKIVAIIRGYDLKETLDIVDALHIGGVRIVEVTLNSPKPYVTISELVKRYGDTMKIGAGTVMNAGEAERAIDEGAQFIISPITDEATIKRTKKLNAVSIPGAFSPIEIFAAFSMGADIIKVFPSMLGPEYIKNIRGPMPNLLLMPTGGVTLQNIPEYLKAGAAAFGVGGGLLKSLSLGDQKYEDIKNNAHAFVTSINFSQ